MSVIFETLQKLKHTGDEIPETMPVSRRRRRTLSVGRSFLSLGVIIGIGVGLLVFFLYGFLGMRGVPDQHVPKRAVAGQDFKRFQATEEVPAKKDACLPPSPDLKTVPATKGKLYLPPSGPKQGREKEIARYLPPISAGRSGPARAAENQDVQYVAAAENGGKARRIAGEKKQMKEPPERNNSREREPNPAEPLPKIAKIQDSSKGKAVPETIEQHKHSSEGGKTGEQMRTAQLAQGKEKAIKQVSPSRRKEMETTKVRTVDRSAQMGLLVARIQQAMRGGDEGEVKTLLERLESLKGRSDYVMRLKAFWYLKEGKYDMARSFLRQLINKNENDLEAGINMAVLDIKTNHIEAARNRLRKLRRLHEDNTTIPALLEKINR